MDRVAEKIGAGEERTCCCCRSVGNTSGRSHGNGQAPRDGERVQGIRSPITHHWTRSSSADVKSSRGSAASRATRACEYRKEFSGGNKEVSSMLAEQPVQKLQERDRLRHL